MVNRLKLSIWGIVPVALEVAGYLLRLHFYIGMTESGDVQVIER
jgi:hypothetical protein